ncbi:prolyl oligopeptidase family serine peptidase [Acetobacteraceae bacterium KSS8]|uniref:Prolyl oligopeptidase family serine peptidase n=1 Tax=Endosaccharibacter trunci TaxID=2812733 RepID=A0ABT1W9Z4_9PROT|nr:prolyl oligopeptidase family serine peptidase [Acetobacteraceae bacterium KSS8]
MTARSRLSLALLLGCGVSLPALAGAAPQSTFDAVSLSPDGATVATITHDPAQGHEAETALSLRPVSGGPAMRVALPCSGEGCEASAPAWSADGKHLAFVLQVPNSEEQSLWETDATGAAPQKLLGFAGLLDKPLFSRQGALSVLAVAHPHKKTGATAAAAAMTGEVGDVVDEQRIALVQNGALHFISPEGLYVYEYDWRPDGSGFVATAAPGDGDANWWVAKLHALGTDGSDRVLFTPGVSQQLADPVVSPDGKSVAFIGGLMSDFGSTGGDAFRLDLSDGARPVDLTPGAKLSVTALSFGCGPGLSATVLRDDRFELTTLDRPSADPHALISVPVGQSVSLGGWKQAIACGGGHAATALEDFTHASALALSHRDGPSFGPLTPIEAVQPADQPAITARSLHWRSDGRTVQGWLLEPTGGAPGKRPLIVNVHGGPSAASMPHPVGHGTMAPLLAAGYDVLLPNARGSFGQGEAFTYANFRDQGHGPLRDILAGVDAAEKAADPAHPIDDKRLGLFGYSYGGYMAMWAPTETDRFRAIVAGAGVSDWLSIEGEEGIATSDIPFFGVSVYDDAKPYLDASPILRMKKVHTPVFVFVGDRDIECPMPQSQEYAQALRMLHKPVEFVVYAGQGHGMANDADRKDSQKRTADWFAKWFASAER